MLAHAQKHLIQLPLAGMALLFAATAADAQISYVGPAGHDSNPCTRAAAPCRSLQRGINVVAAGGDVIILGSGDYGSATITKSLTISGDGATVAVGYIAIDNASAVVALRGLNLVGVGNNDVGGISIVAASAVHIERCTVAHFATHGIYATAPNVEIFVTDSILRDNGAAGLLMYYLNASPSDHGTMTLTFDKSHAEHNGGDGLLIIGGASTFIRSSFSGNHASGINVNYGTATLFSTTSTQNGYAGYYFLQSVALLESSTSQGNDVGLVLHPFGGPTSSISFTASNIVLTNNKSAGILNYGVPVRTRENNTVADNPKNVLGTVTALPGT